jgi:hypothetical protein
MNDQSKTLLPQTLQDTPSVISSQESADGPTPCVSQDGETAGPYGREAVLVNLSASQAKEKGLLTSGTYGLPSCISSESANLVSCLGSKLKRRLGTDGSTWCEMIWKEKATPSGRSVSLLVVSKRVTKEKGCGGWPTPQARDGKDISTTTAYLASSKRHAPSLATRLIEAGVPWYNISLGYCLVMGYSELWNEHAPNATATRSSRKSQPK